MSITASARRTTRSYLPRRRALDQEPRDRPRPVGRVGDHRVRELATRVVRAVERDAGVIALQHHDVTRLCEPEAEAVALRLSGWVAPGTHELRDPLTRNELTGKQRTP